jgi:hypothetical protein
MIGKLLRWLRLRKAEAVSPNPFPEDDSRHEAFEALWAYSQSRRARWRDKKPQGPRELVLREMPDDLLRQSRDLLREYREQWRKVPPEEKEAVFLLPQGDPRRPQDEADRAAVEIERELRRRGVKDRPHYYGAAERRGAGEVDRTYDTSRPEKPVEGLGEEEGGAEKP